MSLRIPMRAYPARSPFVLDWLEGKERATRFLPRPSPGSASRDHPLPHAGEGLIDALIASNRRWGLFVEEQVRRWAAGDTVVLIAGQQVGFGGGPLYTLAKIASLIKMKRDLESGGRTVTLFFWLATEDHDFDEVAKISVPVSGIERADVNRQLDLVCVRATRAVESKKVVGPTPIPEALISEFLALYAMERPQWLREGITFGDSFAELIGSVFGSEVILIDSLLPELRRAGAPLFERVRSQWDALQTALTGRSRELEASGYTAQIQSRAGEPYTLLFEVDERGERDALHAPRATVPERTSTSALTRPLLQDFLFRPAVFLGGPAEVSYYAQIAPLYEPLGVSLPRIALRAHALVAPKRVLRFVDRFDVKPAEIFGSPDALLAERETKEVAEVKRVAGEAEKDVLRHIERIAQIALPAEHSLARAFNRSVGHIEYHFNKLTERAIKALVRKDRERLAAARELIATLYPDRQTQDRIVAWFPLWRQYGRHLVDRLIEEVEPDEASFKVVDL